MIFVLSQRKGGSGKSTIAVNLACALMGRGMEVGLMDTDKQQSTYRWFKRREKRNESNPPVPSPECYFVNGNIRDSIQGMAKRNQHVIIDTAGFDSDEMRQAIICADVVITPFRPKPYDLEQASAHMKLMNEFRIGNPKMRLHAVLNQCPTNHNDSRADGAQDYLAKLEYNVLTSRLSNREAYGDSGQMGLGATEYKADKSATIAADEITAFTREILNG